MTAIQRFGSALNLTPHFHALVFDGVYEGGASVPGRLHPLDPPETDDVARVLAGTARRIRRRLENLGIEQGEDRLAEDEPLLAMLTAASIRSRIATGRKRESRGGDSGIGSCRGLSRKGEIRSSSPGGR